MAMGAALATVLLLSPPPVHPASPQGVFDRLVANVWCDKPVLDGDGLLLHGDYTEWERGGRD